jgi:hypothetical protein
MSIIVLSRRNNALSPMLAAHIIGTADPTEGATFAEVPITAFADTAGVALTSTVFDGSVLDLEIVATVDMRVLVLDPAAAVPTGLQGRRINAGQSLTVAMLAGDKIYTRTA